MVVHYGRGATEAEAVSCWTTKNGARTLQSLERIAQPDDIADTIAFVASGAARWISGDTVRVDGGSKL